MSTSTQSLQNVIGGLSPSSIEDSISSAIPKIKQCFEHYIDKFGKLNNNTALQIVRTIETRIIIENRLNDVRAVRNRIRSLIILKLED